MLFHFCKDLLECFWMVLGKFCKNLSIQINVLSRKCVYELTVGNSVSVEGCGDFCIPERAEFTLLFLSVLEGMCPGVQQGFACKALLVFPSPPVTFRIP